MLIRAKFCSQLQPTILSPKKINKSFPTTESSNKSQVQTLILYDSSRKSPLQQNPTDFHLNFVLNLFPLPNSLQSHFLFLCRICYLFAEH